MGRLKIGEKLRWLVNTGNRDDGKDKKVLPRSTIRPKPGAGAAWYGHSLKE